MNGWLQDIRSALRQMRKRPGLTTVVVLSLGLGIGANTAIFTIINALLLRNIPVPHPEQLVGLSATRPDGEVPFSFPLYREVNQGQEVFSGLIGWSQGGMANVEVNGILSQDSLRAVTGNYYSVLGVSPFLGRLIEPNDANSESGSSSQVAVLGYDFWESRLGGAPEVVGTEIRIEGHAFTIIGITRKWFTGMTPGDQPDITIPVTAQPLVQRDFFSSIEDRSILWLYVAGRLKEGATIPQARAQLVSFWPGVLEATAPTQAQGDRRRRWLSMGIQLTSAAKGFAERLRNQFTQPLLLLLGIVGLILLVACVNVANLILARAVSRKHEMGVRVALGANRWTLARQVLTETCAVSFLGAFLGLALAYWGSRLLLTQYSLTSVALDVRPDLHILAFAISAATLVGVLTGLAPACRASRDEPASVLQHSLRTVAGGSRKLSKTLIITQVALSFVLVYGAGLLLRTFQSLNSVDLGFDKENLLEISLNLRPAGFHDLDMRTYHMEVVEHLSRIQGVRAVGFSDSSVPSLEGWRDMVSVGSEDQSTGTNLMVSTRMVSPGFFKALQIRLMHGRDFEWRDDERHPRVAIVSRSLAERLFPHGDAIGKRVRFGVMPDLQGLQITDVAENARVFDLRDPTAYVLYVPLLQHPKWAQWRSLFVRSSGVPEAVLSAVGREVESLGHEYVLHTRSVSQVTSDLLVAERVTALLSGLFAVLALLLASIGLYGLMSHAVARSTREIGVRIALGASRRGLIWRVLREAVTLISLGIIVGIPCALATTRIIASMLFGISPMDFSTILVVSLLLLAVGTLAGYFPARRASATDPVVALRCE